MQSNQPEEEDKEPESPEFESQWIGRQGRLEGQVEDQIREKWSKEQEALRNQLIEKDAFGEDVDTNDLQNSLKLIGAVDIGYSKTDDRKAVAIIIVMEFPSMKILYEDSHHEIQTGYPYIPGFLAFKEIPVYQTLFDRLKEKHPELIPQVLMVDGNGILHTRQFGCASHIGVQFDIPTIGVAKTPFDVDGMNKSTYKAACQGKLNGAGDHVDLVGNSGKTWGAALRSTQESTNPIFVSIGHRTSLETALKIVKLTISKYRIPDPIRAADLIGRKYVKELYDS